MLEFALRQERIRYAKLLNGDVKEFKEIGLVSEELVNSSAINERIAQRRAKGSKTVLFKFLEDLGYPEIFSESEISEVKSLFDKTASEISKGQQILDTIQMYKTPEEAPQPIASYTRKPTLERELASKFQLKGHLDSVRGTHFVDAMSVAVTISDDCTIKLWDLKIQQAGFG